MLCLVARNQSLNAFSSRVNDSCLFNHRYMQCQHRTFAVTDQPNCPSYTFRVILVQINGLSLAAFIWLITCHTSAPCVTCEA